MLKINKIVKGPRIDAIEKDVVNLNLDFLVGRHFDSLVTERLREAQDFEFNKSREDKIIINGLTNAIPILTLADKKIEV